MNNLKSKIANPCIEEVGGTALLYGRLRAAGFTAPFGFATSTSLQDATRTLSGQGAGRPGEE
ncbi:hypothetical protein FNW02_26445 [Komarekiella sp. 'clone 1']|uniref:Uncharacterized protein n=1 Tax=Komarekiella delphini-convector SJRDD-AB1 TaxID=2593771 RepID=A0AA40T246_9NOST|nr:hypothetical protein [Komarekiella delphini-convector]MBD6619270.1 hypothetical protein [Komarekiella delphini-convector SJRDD-AB1]